MTQATSRGRGREALVLAAFLALSLLVGFRSIFLGSSLGGEGLLDADPAWATGAEETWRWFGDDAPITLDLPSAMFFAHGLREGRLDHWNPLTGAGAPSWVEQSGAFFPLKLVFYAWPTPRSYDLFRVLRLALAGQGAYLLARCLRRGRAASIAAGAIFATSGALLAALPFGNASGGFMLPWLVLAAIRLARDPSPRHAMLAAAVVAITLASGHPTIALLSLAASGAAWLTEALRRARASGSRLPGRLGWATLAGALGLGLAAPVVLPLAELWSLSSSYKTETGERMRQAGRDQVLALAPSALLAPMGLAATPSSAAARAAGRWVLAPAMGGLALALALAGLSRGPGRALGAVLTVGVAVTFLPPGLRLLADLPGMRHVLPWYGWPCLALVASACAARALDDLLAGRGRRTAGAIALILIARAAWSLGAAPAELRPLALPALAAALAAAVAAVAFLACGRRGPGAGILATAGVAEQVVLALLLPEAPRSRALEQVPPLARALREEQSASGGRMGAEGSLARPQTASLFGVADLRSLSALPLARTRRLLDLIEPTRDTATPLFDPTHPLLDACAVTAWIAPAGAPKPPGLLHWEQAGHAVAWLRPSALPRLRLVHEVVIAAGPEDAAVSLLALARDPARLASTAVVEEPLPAQPSSGDSEVVEIRSGDPDVVRARTRSTSPGVLVVADAWHPGWTVTVDDEPSRVLPCNVAFRCVPLAAGEHDVVMRYRPESWRHGLAAAGAAALGCLLLLRRSRQDAAAKGA